MLHIDQAVIYLKSGRVLRVDMQPDGSFGFVLRDGEQVERITYTQLGTPYTNWPTQPVARARILPRKPVDGDRTAWMRDRFGRLRR